LNKNKKKEPLKFQEALDPRSPDASLSLGSSFSGHFLGTKLSFLEKIP
jgi:hypothetical protein